MYIDDLCIFNYQHFDSLLMQIYLDDLIAERNGNNNKCVTYLDVSISAFQNGVHSSVYHKVDDFRSPFLKVIFLPIWIVQFLQFKFLRYLRIISYSCHVVDKIKIRCQLSTKRDYFLCDSKR